MNSSPPGHRTRVPFTTEDDALLVKYIAKYNPALRGRLGNALYKTLVDNVDRKWNWAKNHPWQAWRERYKNNQEEFNYKIKRYQKKHGINTTGDQTSKKRNKAAARNAKREEEEEDSDEISASIAKREEEEEDSDDIAGSHGTSKRKRDDGHLPMRRTKAKRNIEVENDISSGEETKRKPPTNGPLATVASKGEHASVEEQGGEQDGDVRENPGADVEDDPEGVHPDEDGESSGSHEVVDPPTQSSLIPVLSQPHPHPMEGPLPAPGALDSKERSSQNPHPSQEHIPPLPNSNLEPVLTDTDKLDIPAGGRLLLRKKSAAPMKHRRRSGSDEMFESAPPTPEERTNPHPERLSDPLRLIEGPFGSVFVDGRSNARPSVRADMDTPDSDEEEVSSGQIVEASAWPPRRSARAQRPVVVEDKGTATEMHTRPVDVAPSCDSQGEPPSRGAVDINSPLPSSPASQLSITSQLIIMDVGYDTVIQRMADNHGFSVEVVKRLVAQVKELKLADFVLRKMRKSAAATATDSVQDIVTDLDDEGEYSTPTHKQTSRRASGNKLVHGTRHSSPQSSPQRGSSLHITPAVLDADYSPPETSRASHFARLERQGRRQEAFKWESRRVSLGRRMDFLRSIKIPSSRSASRSKKARVSPESPLGQVNDPPMLAGDSAPSSPPMVNESFHRGMSNAKALDEIGELFKWCI